MPPKIIFVYVLIDPRYPSDVRYVGVTDNPKKRLNSHITRSKNQTHHRARWINSLVRDGIKPIMTIIDETDEDNWQQCEIAWIAYYREMGCKLVNSSDGGRGTLNPSEETRHKRSKSLRGKPKSQEHKENLSKSKIENWENHSMYGVRGENHPNYGRTHSEESRKKMSESRKGKTFTDEHRHNMSEARKRNCPISKKEQYRLDAPNRIRKPTSEETRRKRSEALRGKPKSQEHRNNLSKSKKKPIIQYSKNNGFIRMWDGVIDASKELGIEKANIASCCRGGKQKSAGGYIWRYADDPLPINETQLRLLQFEDENK